MATYYNSVIASSPSVFGTSSSSSRLTGMTPVSEPVNLSTLNPSAQVVQGADGKAYTKLPQQSNGVGGGWLDISTGQRVGSITLAAKPNVASSLPGVASGGFGGVGGGSTYGGMGFGGASGGTAQNPLEFYLGPAPTLEE